MVVATTAMSRCGKSPTGQPCIRNVSIRCAPRRPTGSRGVPAQSRCACSDGTELYTKVPS